MITSDSYKYYRSLNIKVKNDFVIDKLGSKTIFILASQNSFYIYDVEKFNILFIGPYIPKIEKMFFHKDILYIISELELLFYKRGVLFHKMSFDTKIEGVQCLDNLLFVKLGDGKMNLYETTISCGEDRFTKCETMLIHEMDNVTNLHHPKAYLNKILVSFKDKIVMYNFIKSKVVYEYKNIEPGYLKIRDTKVLDIVGIVYENKIEIVNLKLDKILYTIDTSSENRSEFVDLDFSDDKLLFVKNNVMVIYDLMDKFKICYKTDVLNGKFIDNSYILVNTGSEISICEISNGKLNVIKNKLINISGIKGLEFVNNKNFVIINEDSVVRYNIYNDNNSIKILIDKNAVNIENDNCEMKFAVYKDNVMIYKKNTLYRTDLVNNRSTFILRNQIEDLSLYKERVLFVTGKYNIMNINSKLIHYKLDKKFDNVCYYEDFVISYTGNKVNIFHVIKKTDYELEIADIVNIRVIEDFICIQTKSGLLFYNFNEETYFRKYDIPDILDFDINNKILCVLQSDKVLIYDILSNIVVDEILSAVPCKFIRFSRDNFFILLVSELDEIILLCNKVYNVDHTELSEFTLDLDILQTDKVNENVQWNINEIFNIKYSELDINEILEDILNNLETDYIKYNALLNKVLKKYYKNIDKERIREVYSRYKVISDQYMEDFMRCIKY